MKLLSIHLHPFGGIADRRMAFQAGLNVLEGPNEYGKTTLTQALWHALHTPTNLTPSKLRKAVGDWFPLPDGDHARVTLVFEAGGHRWTLEKTWGAGGASRLQADGVPVIADAGRVQQRLNELLRLNEATWRQVLFTGQAQLAGTISALRDNGGQLDEVHALLKGAAAVPGDIPAERLQAALDEELEDHFSRWDRDRNGPEGGRGITNPWKNKLGRQVEAWYTMERARAEHQRVLQYEQDLDAVNARIRELTEAMAADAAFVQEGKGLRQGLGRRGELEQKVQRLVADERNLTDIATAWPAAAGVMQAKEAEMQRLEATLKELGKELEHARKRAAAADLRKGHQRLVAAKEALEAANRKLAETPAVDLDLLQDLEKLERTLGELHIKVEARRLAAELESDGARTVTVQRGAGEAETIELAPGQPWTGEAAGRLVVQAGDLRLTVRSAEEDVEALLDRKRKAEQRRGELLKLLGMPGFREAEAAAKRRSEAEGEVVNCERLYQAALQDRTEQEWAADVAALEALPETRGLQVLEQERERLLAQQADLKAAVRNEQEKVERWAKEYIAVDALMQRIIGLKGDLKATREELEKLPALPEGWKDVTAYLNRLDEAENTQTGRRDLLQEAREAQARLEGGTPERTAEELQAELEVNERAFARAVERGQALLRIRDRLQHLVAERGDGDPLAGLAEGIATHLGVLTGRRYTAVELDGTAPASVGGERALPADRLSRGTLGSLALATRLALAELYLKDDDGFLLLDDPFTDMDPARRTAAAGALAAFANERQVLLLTCHPGHARELNR